MPNVSEKTVTKRKEKPVNPLSVVKSNYQPAAPVHFEELCNIWENDHRIPTIASRTAWSLARNLNPININSWWYRRKIIAKKFNIKIPGGSYELDVGTPPLVVVKSENLPTSIPAPESAGSDSTLPNSGSGDTLVDSSSSICDDPVASKKGSSEYMDAHRKRAYIYDSEVSEDVILASDCTSAPPLRGSSPLPPSSPNVWPSSPLPLISRVASPEVNPDVPNESTTPAQDCTLVLNQNFSTSVDDWKRLDLDAELNGPFEVLSELLAPFQPCQWSEAFLSFYNFPTWCFAGLRAAYDGSIVCDCLCSTRPKPCSGDGHLNALTSTEGLGDVAELLSA